MTTLTYWIRSVFLANKYFEFRRMCMAVKLFYDLNRFRHTIYCWCSRIFGRRFVALQRVGGISFYTISAVVVAVQTNRHKSRWVYRIFACFIFPGIVSRRNGTNKTVMPTSSVDGRPCAKHNPSSVLKPVETRRRRRQIVIPRISWHLRDTTFLRSRNQIFIKLLSLLIFFFRLSFSIVSHVFVSI